MGYDMHTGSLCGSSPIKKSSAHVSLLPEYGWKCDIKIITMLNKKLKYNEKENVYRNSVWKDTQQNLALWLLHHA